MNSNLRIALSIIVLLLAVTGLLFSANATTTASGGNWSSTSTWSAGTLPLATDNVVIVNGASLTVDGADTCASFTWQYGNKGGELTINSGPSTLYIASRTNDAFGKS